MPDSANFPRVVGGARGRYPVGCCNVSDDWSPKRNISVVGAVGIYVGKEDDIGVVGSEGRPNVSICHTYASAFRRLLKFEVAPDPDSMRFDLFPRGVYPGDVTVASFRSSKNVSARFTSVQHKSTRTAVIAEECDGRRTAEGVAN